MAEIPAYLRVKFGEEVQHDEPYDGKPPDFFDRDDVQQRALAILRSPQTQRAVWLVGERRAGKSSMLNLLIEKCQKDGFLTVNLSWLVIHSAQDFYKEFLGRLDNALGAQTSEPINSAIAFWKALQERRKHIGQRTLVVGVDEIDSILEPVDENSAKEILDSVLRLVTQEPNTKVILTSARSSSKIEQFKASPLVSRSEEVSLPPFSDADLIQLTRSLASELSDEDVKQIISISGGWPYYAKAILYHLLQLPAADSQRLERARSEAVNSIALTCDHLYRHHWDEDEKRALWLLANKEQINPEEFKALDAALRAAMQELTRRSYLLEENGQYRFRILLIADWLKGWPRREVEEEKLGIPSFLKKMMDPWAKQPGEQMVRVTKENLRKRGF